MSSKFHQRPQTNCVEPTIRKLTQSEVDRMVQEAEKSRDEDEVDQGRLRAVTDTDEDMDRILITNDSHVEAKYHLLQNDYSFDALQIQLFWN